MVSAIPHPRYRTSSSSSSSSSSGSRSMPRLRRDFEAAADELTIRPCERGALLLDGGWCDVGVADDRAGRT
jgi:hypothetical protein